MLDILYQDDFLIAINKPVGLPVHRSPFNRDSCPAALQLLRNQTGRAVYPVHRLDRSASGALVFACDSETARGLVRAFTDRTIRKTYLCVVRGYTDEQGLIDYPLRPDQNGPEKPAKPSDGASAVERPAKEAITAYRSLGRIEIPFPVSRYPTSRYTLLEVMPRTGRHHQIRRHLKHIYHPIIGDVRHGEGRHNRFFRERFGCSRLLLAAMELSFIHPTTGKPLTLVAPLDASFSTLIDRCGWSGAIPASWLSGTSHTPDPVDRQKETASI